MAVRLFIGWTGFGKSLAMQDMSADAAADGHLVLTVDRAREWRTDAVDEEGRSRWRDDPPELYEWPQEMNRDELFKRLCEQRDKPVEERGCVVRFDFPWNGLKLGTLARELGSCMVVDDEADYTAGHGNWEAMHCERPHRVCGCGNPECALDDYSLNPYRDFVHRGRHLPSPVDGVPRVVHLLGAMRRPENVHTDLTAIAEEVMMFRIGGHTTLDRISREGWLADDQLEEVQRLPKLHYLLYRKGEQRAVPGIVTGLE